MPRSFLVKKYFSNKKLFLRDAECTPQVELPVQNHSLGLTYYSAAPCLGDVDPMLGPLSPVSPVSPLDLSSGEEEEEDRSSDPPSPDVLQPIYLLPPTTEPTVRSAFFCKHCPKEYSSLGALKMHIRSHTLPCVCPTCGKAFSRPWLLRGHIRTHTGERPFSCPHCQRAFADRSNLRAHLQTHSEVKRYRCALCCRTFSRMSLLQKHSGSRCCPL